MLASDPSIFIPGFEPLDFPGLSAAAKTAFMEAVFTFPPSEAQHAGWRREVLRGKRIDRSQLADHAQLANKTVAGFKMRPYTLDGDGGSPGDLGGKRSDGGNRSRLHTAATGISPAVLKALLDRYNVSVVLTLRRNRLKEALSWYKARALGINQFQGKAKGAKASASSAAAAEDGLESGPGQEPQPLQDAPKAGSAGAEVLAGGGKVAVNVTAVRGWLAYTEAVNAALRRAVVAAQRPTLTVWYEDFLDDPLGQAQRAAAFVGAPNGGRGVTPTSKFRKAGPDAIHDWVENFQVRGQGVQATLAWISGLPVVTRSQAGAPPCRWLCRSCAPP
jgi:hypothetical protein